MPARILASARTQAWHFWPALSEADSLRVPVAPPSAFAPYLVKAGVRPPEFVPDGPSDTESDPERIFTPFGWNAEAHRLNRASGRAARAPAFETVRRVNSRAFGAALERALFPEEACPTRFWATVAQLKSEIATLAPGRYVAKGNYGLAGIGQMRFEVGEGGAARFAAPLRRLLERHAGLAVEREQAVDREFGVLFRVGREGRSELRVHRLWTSADGGFVGSLVLPERDPMFESHRERIEICATEVSSALANEDYFGVVSLDTYIWRDGSDMDKPARFRPLVDLNARASMAWPAHGLAAAFPGRAAAVAQFSSTALNVPRDYDALARAWGDLAFDPARGTGVLWITPLIPLPRHSLAFIGADAADVERLRAGVARATFKAEASA